MNNRLSMRLRDGVEAARWVISEVKSLEVSYERLSNQRLHLLEKMESIGWPCALDELPDRYKKLEKELSDAYLEIVKLRPKAVFDRDVHTRAKEWVMGYKLNIYVPEEVVENVCLTCEDTGEMIDGTGDITDYTGIVNPQGDEGNE